MEKFPAEFNPEKIFPLPSKNPELANLRREIVAGIRNTGCTNINGMFYVNPYRIHLYRPVTYRNLMTIHQELSERGFIIHYELNMGDPHSIMATKKVSFSEIDPYGNIPTALILGSKTDAEHF